MQPTRGIGAIFRVVRMLPVGALQTGVPRG
jgi:hypothetical protein